MSTHDDDVDSTSLSSDASEMLSTPAARLRWAREQTGFKSIAKAAEALGFHKQNLADHEAGRRRFSPEQAALYAKAFRIHKGWLLYGEGSPKQPDLVELDVNAVSRNAIGVLGETKRWYHIDEAKFIEGLIAISMSAIASEHMFAVRVGDREHEKFKAGSLLICCFSSQVRVKDDDWMVSLHKEEPFFEYKLTSLGDTRIDEELGVVIAVIEPVDSRPGTLSGV